MPIKAPSWAKGAHPTLRGWVRNGELLKGQKISQADIDAWYGKEVAAPAPAPQPEPVVEAVVEEVLELCPCGDPDCECKPGECDCGSKVEITEEALEEMTKKEIDDLAAEQGIELDRRYTKKTMISKLMDIISK